MYQHDYIKRQIELFAEALARLARKRQAGASDEAQEELKQAYEALGIDPGFLRLDAVSLVRLLRDVAKLNALCDLLEEEARLLDSQQRLADALSRRKQAHCIREAMIQRCPTC